MKTFHQTTWSMLCITGTSVRYSSSYTMPFLDQMFSDIEKIKVLGAYIFVFGVDCPLLIRVLPNTRDIDHY